MSAACLSHHDILGLIEPFSRTGRELDLAASDRLQRRLVFRSRVHPGAAPDGQDVRESLVLDKLLSGTWRLLRSVSHPSGLQADVQALGTQPGELLARLDAVAMDRLFRSGPGFVLARSYLSQAAGRGPAALVLTRAALQAKGAGQTLKLEMNVSAVRGVAADLSLVSLKEPLALPQDLLAVLGWHWTRLVPARQGWKSKLRLRGNAARRTAAAEAALDRAAVHLAQTLCEAPARFHDRHVRARLGVVARRAIPLLTPLVLVATILLMPRLEFSGSPGLWLVLYHVPTVLIMLSFRLQELPTLAIPPWPQRSSAADWRLGAAAATSGGVRAQAPQKQKQKQKQTQTQTRARTRTRTQTG